MDSVITPEDIPRICEELGVQPRRGVWVGKMLSGAQCVACLCGVLTASREGWEAAVARIYDSEDVDSTLSAYECGLSDGREDGEYYRSHLSCNPDYQDGLTFGAAAWKACLEAGLCTE